MDWIKNDEFYPLLKLRDEQRITALEYDGAEQRRHFGRQEVGIGATMFFNAAYWILGNLEPSEIYFAGCSMDYPGGKANTFYGAGNADPLRFTTEYLTGCFEKFAEHAKKRNCQLINIGSKNGLMPY